LSDAYEESIARLSKWRGAAQNHRRLTSISPQDIDFTVSGCDLLGRGLVAFDISGIDLDEVDLASTLKFLYQVVKCLGFVDIPNAGDDGVLRIRRVEFDELVSDTTSSAGDCAPSRT
jgi:hypothetical protein